MAGLLNELMGGERRSIGRATEVARRILDEASPLDEIFAGLLLDNVILRSRSAHVFFQISRERPEWVQPFLPRLLGEIALIPQWEVREQICKILPRLQLTTDDLDRTVRLFQTYLEDKSSIVKTCAMQGLCDLLEHDPELEPLVRGIVENLTLTGSAAMRARGRKLIKQLDRARRDRQT